MLSFLQSSHDLLSLYSIACLIITQSVANAISSVLGCRGGSQDFGFILQLDGFSRFVVYWDR